jgi:hypothetical protein
MNEPNPLTQRRTMMPVLAASAVFTVLLWVLLLAFLPAFQGADALRVALQSCAAAALLTLFVGVNSIAHERLVSPAIDPLAGHETQRMRINARYLSNTVEQFLIFAAGLLALSAYAGARVIITAAIVWVLNRWAFWIGYHRNPLLRAYGAVGILQSLIILLYVSWRFGFEFFGWAGGAVLVGAFLLIEGILFGSLRRPSPN